MDDLIDIGYQAFNPIQPNAMDIMEVKRRWGHKLCLIGNINLDSTLTIGTPEDVKAEVYERIRTIAPGGGYMVASSNSITDYVPLENMKAMLSATYEYGSYPINLEKGGLKGKIWTFTGKPIQKQKQRSVDASVEKFASLLVKQNLPELIESIENKISSGKSISIIIKNDLVPAMTLIGYKYQVNEIYIPEMISSANTMSKVLLHLKDKIVDKQHEEYGRILIGTVRGDLHDIGKNLVIMMLEGQGFEVIDLGISVGEDVFIKEIKENRPQIVAMSALLTTTMIEMKNTINAIKEAGLRNKVKIIIGGAPVTQSFADEIGADGYAYDAPGAALKCKELLS
jgi:5-methyltetrahydrofolate--homocysteine methyltransferase